jgi:hypothetical protein
MRGSGGGKARIVADRFACRAADQLLNRLVLKMNGLNSS